MPGITTGIEYTDKKPDLKDLIKICNNKIKFPMLNSQFASNYGNENYRYIEPYSLYRSQIVKLNDSSAYRVELIKIQKIETSELVNLKLMENEEAVFIVTIGSSVIINSEELVNNSNWAICVGIGASLKFQGFNKNYNHETITYDCFRTDVVNVITKSFESIIDKKIDYKFLQSFCSPTISESLYYFLQQNQFHNKLYNKKSISQQQNKLDIDNNIEFINITKYVLFEYKLIYGYCRQIVEDCPGDIMLMIAEIFEGVSLKEWRGLNVLVAGDIELLELDNIDVVNY
ncbi:MAG: hypothetical protein HRU35_02915 [Rickettsiaceae bacterium]|nr:hypothetical protein [Rickettsiaceae bacterium]